MASYGFSEVPLISFQEGGHDAVFEYESVNMKHGCKALEKCFSDPFVLVGVQTAMRQGEYAQAISGTTVIWTHYESVYSNSYKLPF